MVINVEKIISFIVENWRIIADVCAALLALVLFICRKKPVKVVDSIYQELTELLITAVDLVEKKGHGDEKKASVLAMVQDWLCVKHPEVDLKVYLDFASKMIEDILSTPQKKGE